MFIPVNSMCAHQVRPPLDGVRRTRVAGREVEPAIVAGSSAVLYASLDGNDAMISSTAAATRRMVSIFRAGTAM